eukprot:scaffold278485_cov33-Tisochrysis_lutea.AAC.2
MFMTARSRRSGFLVRVARAMRVASPDSCPVSSGGSSPSITEHEKHTQRRVCKNDVKREGVCPLAKGPASFPPRKALFLDSDKAEWLCSGCGRRCDP